jgi:hypothetical protein
MRSRKVVWGIFACLVVAAALYYRFCNTGEDDNSQGRCACGGFFFLIVVVVGTVIEALTTREKHMPGRGSDPPDGHS